MFVSFYLTFAFNWYTFVALKISDRITSQKYKKFQLPDRYELSSINSGCGKSGSSFGSAVYSNRALMFGMLALVRDAFFGCNTVSILPDENVKIVYINVYSSVHIVTFSVVLS